MFTVTLTYHSKGKKSKDIKKILKEEWECYALKQDSLNDTLSV